MIVFITFTFILFYILFSISKEDFKTLIISEKKIRFFALTGFLYLICLGLSSNTINTINLIFNNIFSMFTIFTLMYSIKFISYKLLGINSLGLGDIKLSSVSSIWLGLESTFLSLCISFILSAIYGLKGKITKRFKIFHQYPFAPFLSIGISCAWILDKI